MTGYLQTKQIGKLLSVISEVLHFSQRRQPHSKDISKVLYPQCSQKTLISVSVVLAEVTHAFQYIVPFHIPILLVRIISNIVTGWENINGVFVNLTRSWNCEFVKPGHELIRGNLKNSGFQHETTSNQNYSRLRNESYTNSDLYHKYDSTF